MDNTDSKLVRPGDPRVPCFAILGHASSELKLINLEGVSSSSVKISGHWCLGIVTIDNGVFAVTVKEILKLHSDGSKTILRHLRGNLDLNSQVVSFQKKIYILPTPSKSMLCFDPADNSLTDDLPGCGLDLGFCASANDYFIYAMGGALTETRAMKYDPLTRTWEETAPMTKGRWLAAAATLDGKIHVMGGADCGISVEYYNDNSWPTHGNDSWTEISNMNVGRTHFSACVVGDQLYAVGGDGENELFQYSIEVYDKNKWTAVTKFETKDQITYSCFWPYGSHQPGNPSLELQRYIGKLESSATKEERLKLFHKILEYEPWKQQHIAKTIRNIDFSGITLQQRDILAIGSIINHLTHLDLLNLKACKLLPGSLQILRNRAMKISKVDKFRVDSNPNLAVDDLIAGVDLCARVGARYVYDFKHLSVSDRQKFVSHSQKYERASGDESGRRHLDSKSEDRLAVEPAEGDQEEKETLLDTELLGGENSSGTRRKSRPRTLNEYVKLKPVVKFNKIMKSISSGEENLESVSRANRARMLKTMAMKSDRRRFELVSLNIFGSNLRSYMRNTRPETSTAIVKSSKYDSGYKTRSSFSDVLSCKSNLRRYSRRSDQDTERKKSIESTQADSLERIEEVETSDEKSGSSESGTSPKTVLTHRQKHEHNPKRLIEQKFEMTVLGLGAMQNRQERVQLWIDNAQLDVLPTDLADSSPTTTFEEINDESESATIAVKCDDGTESENTDTSPTTTSEDINDESESATIAVKQDDGTEAETGGATTRKIPDDEPLQLKFRYSPRNAEKKIGPEGGNLLLDECSLAILTNSLADTRNLRISMLMDFQNLALPADMTPVSPYLDVKFCGQLLIPAKARVPTWFKPSKDSEHGIKIFKRYLNDENEFSWRELQIEAKLHDEIIEFEVDHFCGFIALIKNWLWGSGEIKLTHGLFHLDRNFLSVICYRTPEYLFQDLIAYLKEISYKEIHRNRFVLNRSAPVRMECLDPHLHEFEPQQYLLTSSNVRANESVQFAFLLRHLEEPKEEVDIRYIVGEFSAPFAVKLPAVKDVQKKSEHHDSNEGEGTNTHTLATFSTGSSPINMDRCTINVSATTNTPSTQPK